MLMLWKRGRSTWLPTLGLLLVACAMEPVHFESVHPSVSAPMIASKVQTPVYIVLDPNKVPDEYVTSRSDAKPVELYQIRSFVSRDLVATLESFFSNVQVVDQAPEDTSPHIIVDVEVSKFDTIVDKAMASGPGGSATAFRIYGTMDWKLALRHSDEPEYFFSFSDHVVGDQGGTTVRDTNLMFKSVLEAALGRFLEKYTAGGAHERAQKTNAAPSDEEVDA